MITLDTSHKIMHVQFPWQEVSADLSQFIWRYSGNPIIKEDHIAGAAGICNSAVIEFGDEYAGIFRIADKTQNLNLHVGFSQNGIEWDINSQSIEFICDEPYLCGCGTNYDPRVCKIDEKFYITWCTVNAYGAPSIGIGYTIDFKKFYRLENAFLPCNRNGVLFPRKINNKYAMLSRPSDMGHTPFGDIYYSQSPDMRYWGDHRFVMGTGKAWESVKVGPGPIPIETPHGWLMIYHGVQQSCSGYIYSMGVALLDIDQPWKIIKKSRGFLMNPQENYERTGIVNNVVFPCSALHDVDTGRVVIYYGAADSVIALAFTTMDNLMEYLNY